MIILSSFIDKIISILPFLFLITIVVFVHELGHYIFARINGVHVEQFAIGFGSKKIFSFFDKNKTLWSIRPFPLGGFVQLKGDADSASAFQKEIGDESKIEKDSILSKKAYQKFLIAIGGPLFNFIFSLFVIFVLYFSIGKKVYPPVITSVEKHSIAENIGIEKGFKIIEINKKEIKDFRDVQKIILLSEDLKFNFKFLNNKNNLIEKKITFKNRENLKFGISSNLIELKKLNLIDSLKGSFDYLFENITLTFKSLKLLISGNISKDNIGGPIAIAKQSQKAFELGIYTFFIFISLISINLGIINMLPIPIVDGGQALIHLIEMIIKKDLTFSKFKKYLMYLGYLILILITILAFFNDIKKIIL